MSNKPLNQRGVVSLIVCMIMMLVISLVSVGYIQLSDNEQKSALNNQLSQSAYYAAESGVNIVHNYIQQGNSINTNVTNCNPSSVIGTYTTSSINNSSFKVSYPCININSTPQELIYTVAAGSSRVIPVSNTNLINLVSSVTISWSELGGDNIYSGCNTLSTLYTLYSSQKDGCSASLLQLDISDTNLMNTQKTIYLEPQPCNQHTPCSNNLSDNSKSFNVVNCNKNSLCSVNLNSSLIASGVFYIRVTPIYGSNTNLIVTGTNQDGSSFGFSKAEVQVTSTGRAQNVEQAITAYIDVTGNSSSSPVFAIQSNKAICDELQGYQKAGGDFKQVTDTDCSSQ